MQCKHGEADSNLQYRQASSDRLLKNSFRIRKEIPRGQNETKENFYLFVKIILHSQDLGPPEREIFTENLSKLADALMHIFCVK